MELWCSAACPYSTQVRIALAEKGLAYVEHEIELGAKPAELVALNPEGSVPVLVAGERVITNTAEILEYLEQTQPVPALLPREASERAAVSRFRERAVSAIGKQLPKVRRGAPEVKAAAEAEVRAALAALEAEAPSSGFFFGSFGLADVALVCFVARLPEPLQPSALGLPRLAGWDARTRARPSVARYLAPSGVSTPTKPSSLNA